MDAGTMVHVATQYVVTVPIPQHAAPSAASCPHPNHRCRVAAGSPSTSSSKLACMDARKQLHGRSLVRQHSGALHIAFPSPRTRPRPPPGRAHGGDPRRATSSYTPQLASNPRTIERTLAIAHHTSYNRRAP